MTREQGWPNMRQLMPDGSQAANAGSCFASGCIMQVLGRRIYDSSYCDAALPSVCHPSEASGPLHVTAHHL